ncbi:MAG TPA: CHC2 zinc finger domain-containing protein [Rhizobiaceae bacterium]|nr:CHC2 zinc finger domain-containing protein [Rhizobiaceae bacterium]
MRGPAQQFSDTFLDEIKAAVPISELIGGNVEWDRRTSRPTRGDWWACCPFHGEKTPSFHCDDGRGHFKCFGCGASGDHFGFLMAIDGLSFPRAVTVVSEMAGIRLPNERGETAEEKRQREARQQEHVQRGAADAARRKAEATEERQKAQRVWARGQPIKGMIAERYMRVARGVTCPLPPTLRYLPARTGYTHALMAAFGIASEPEPGRLAIDDEAVQGVHLIRLRPDGSDKAEKPNKITIGRWFSAPIMLAPPNDLLGLVIAEGIEDALSAHQATGLGAWAAGGADRMPALAAAVPGWVDCVTILVDDNEAGRGNSAKLAERLGRRGIYCELLDAPGRSA